MLPDLFTTTMLQCIKATWCQLSSTPVMTRTRLTSTQGIICLVLPLCPPLSSALASRHRRLVGFPVSTNDVLCVRLSLALAGRTARVSRWVCRAAPLVMPAIASVNPPPQLSFLLIRVGKAVPSTGFISHPRYLHQCRHPRACRLLGLLQTALHSKFASKRSQLL